MNNANVLPFSQEKPAVQVLTKSDAIKVIAIGLLQNQALKKHSTSIPTFLVVVKGSISFRIHGVEQVLQELGTYAIPVNEEHEVVGLNEENVFLLIQEK